MMAGIGVPELLIVLVIALIVLGPKKLPEAGKSLGRGLREFKDSVSGVRHDDEDDELPTLAAAPTPAVAATPATDPAPVTRPAA